MSIQVYQKAIRLAENELRTNGLKAQVPPMSMINSLSKTSQDSENSKHIPWLLRAILVEGLRLVLAGQSAAALGVLGHPVTIHSSDSDHLLWSGLVALNRGLVRLSVSTTNLRAVAADANEALNALAHLENTGRWYARACLLCILTDVRVENTEAVLLATEAARSLHRKEDSDLLALAQHIITSRGANRRGPITPGLRHMYCYNT